MLKILQVHNRYLTGLGGEDAALAEERDLLTRRGHAVEQLIVTLREEDVKPGAAVALSGLRTVWSPAGYRCVRAAVQRHRPDIVHVHNTFPLLSPSVYWAARRSGVPVVQTLHNYRLACANGLLLREGVPCELCVGHFPAPALRYRCFKRSLAATAAVVAMQSVHRVVGSYATQVDAYIALTEFARAIMTRAGLPNDQIHVKPNCVSEELGMGEPPEERAPQVVFAGRIAPEKGLDLLMEAWAALGGGHGHKLKVLGDGPERGRLQERFSSDKTIEWRGSLERRDAITEFRRSRFLVIASRWYEGLPMVLLEAFCAGTPVIAPRLGAFPELIGEGRLGSAFEPGSAASLRDALHQALALTPKPWREKSTAVRAAYEERYTPEVSYRQLLQIYHAAIERFRGSRP